MKDIITHVPVYYTHLARIMDQLAEAGVVGEEEGTKPRKVPVSYTHLDTENAILDGIFALIRPVMTLTDGLCVARTR